MDIDYSKIPTQDLLALKSGNYRAVSTATLDMLSGAGNSNVIRTEGNPDASTAEINAMRRRFINDEAANAPGRLTNAATMVQKLSPILNRYDVVGKLTDTVRGTEDIPVPVERKSKGQGVIANLKEMATNVPVSVAKTAYGMMEMPTAVSEAAMNGQLGDLAAGTIEQIGTTVGLNGLDRAADRWVTDPAGAAMDVSMLKGGYDVGKSGAKAVGSYAAGGAEGLSKKLAQINVKQPTMLNTSKRAANIETLLENNILDRGVIKGVPKLEGLIQEGEGKLGGYITQADTAGVRGTMQGAIDNLEALKQEAKFTSDPQGNIDKIDAEIARLQANPLLDSSGQLPLSDLQQSKVVQGKEIANKYIEKQGQSETFDDKIDKARVRGFKEEIENQFDNAFPSLAGELKANNKQLSDFYAVRKNLGQAAGRIENNQGVGIGTPIKVGTGTAIGSMIGGPVGAQIGGYIGTLVGVVEHPAVAARIAQGIYNVNKKKGMTRTQAMLEAKQGLARMAASMRAMPLPNKQEEQQ